MGFLDFLFGKKKTNLEQADKLNDTYIEKHPNPENKENEMMRNASKLLTSGKFQESLELYKELADTYPERQALYQSQVGVAYHFMGDYDNASKYYLTSLENGGDRSMMDDNLWEAAEENYKQLKSTDEVKAVALVAAYIKHFPDGNHVKKANKILN